MEVEIDVCDEVHALSEGHVAQMVRVINALSAVDGVSQLTQSVMKFSPGQQAKMYEIMNALK